MIFEELHDLPNWLKYLSTALIGAGGAKILAVWLENRRLEKKDYRDTLLGRIHELEATIQGMQERFTELRVQLALVMDENGELKVRAEKCDAQQKKSRRNGGSDAESPGPV